MLKANSLYFQRNGQYVLQDISFEVKAGSCLVVRGANGVGKSTLLRLIAGFIIPNSGSISLHGKFINDDLDFFSEHVEYIGHSHGVKRSMSVIETIQLWNSLYGNLRSKLPSALRIDEIKNQLISHCSAGQIQRLSLSRLELTKKKIWLLDEPTSALDGNSETIFRQIIDDHCKSGGIAIVATHDDIDFGHQTELMLQSKTQYAVGTPPFDNVPSKFFW